MSKTNQVPPIVIQEVLIVSKSGNFVDLLVKAPIRIDPIRDRDGKRTEPKWLLRDFVFRTVPVKMGVLDWTRWHGMHEGCRTPEMARFTRVWKGFEVEFPLTLPVADPIAYRDFAGYGELMTLEEFRGCLRDGAISSSDGVGYYATATQESSVPVVFDADYVIEPPGLTHVMWYNK